MWEWKKTIAKSSGTNTQQPKHHQLVPNQYKKSGPIVKGFRGCGLVKGGKEPIFSFQPGSLLGKCFVGMTFFPKRMVDSWYHLMHAKEVSNEKPQSLIYSNNRKRLITKSNKWKFVMEWVVKERECTGHVQ